MKLSYLESLLRILGLAISRLAGTGRLPLFRQATLIGRAVVGALALVLVGSAVRGQTHPSGDSTHFVRLMGPIGGQQFHAPGMIRVFVAASDINNWPNQRRAASVEIMVNDTIWTTIPGDQSEYWVYKANLTGIPVGQHRIWARGRFVDGKVFDSAVALIKVEAPPTYGDVVNLTGNVVLSGSQNYELIGTPSARIRLNGHGFTISSSASWSGRLTLKYVDVVNLGALMGSTPGISVSTTSAITVENCIFDATNSLDVAAQGTAPCVIRSNEFRSNMFMNVAQFPINLGSGVDHTTPVIRLQGDSTTPKYFQGNNVGLSTIEVVHGRNWLLGGSTDAEANVLIGPRVGIELVGGSGIQIRRNISDQLYYGGWSQGNNFEMNSGSDLLVEHNLISGGSWPIRGFGGTLRYNLVLNAGEDWLWITRSNASVHHNIFAEGDNDRAGIFLIYGPKDVQFYNNTLDSYSPDLNQVPFLAGEGSTSIVHSNVFHRFSGTPVIGISGGSVTANHNLFHNPGVASIKNYSDNRHPAQDVGGLNAQVDPRFATPTPPSSASLNRADIWTRTLTLQQILSAYRNYYTPAAGSPLTDAGDPAGGAGNDIGAVGSGMANAADRFGLLEAGVPEVVTVSVQPGTASLTTGASANFSATVQGSANQAVTWSVVEVGGGTITSAGVYTAPTVAGTYHVKAVAAADPLANAQATITVSAPPPPPPPIPVELSIAPSTAQVATGATRSFSATVTGSANQSVTWSVVETGGGSITSAGLYTAPAVAGTYHVKAVAAADPSVSAQATITVSAPTTPPANPSGDATHFVRLMGPVGGQRFLAPGLIRVFVAASDLNNWANYRRAASVEIMVNDTVRATIPGNQSEYIVYKANLTGLPAGQHRIWARARFVDGKVFDSEAALVTVEATPAYAQVVNLPGNVVLSGTQNYELIGTPTARIRLNGNGFTLTSNSSWKGRLTLKHVDVVNLGVLASATPGVRVTTTAGVEIENCVFDATQALDLTVQGTAYCTIRSNEFRSNMLMNVAQQPINIGSGSSRTGPVLRLRGNSTAQHYFQGNNVGLSTIEVVNARNWLFGGSTDAEANVLIGPRVGIELTGGSGIQIRRNISDQIYYGGWSQGNNFEMNTGSDLLVEHNLVSGGSWPIRGFGGTLRYNLVLNAGEDWLWITGNNASVHHNIFAEGENNRAGIFLIYGPKDVRFYNNTIDGYSPSATQVPFLAGEGSTSILHSNVFHRLRGTPVVAIAGGSVTANHNLFNNPGVSSIKNYGDNRHPAQDVGGLNAQVDPRFATPTPPPSATLNRADMWNRALTLKQILATYRNYYTPAGGSPLTDAGDPSGGAGNDIGAVGSGLINAADQFGLLDGGTPPSVAVSVQPGTASLTAGGTASFSATVYGNTNQSVTWSVVEAGGGTITSAGLYTAPAVAGTYHVKAVAAADPTATAQATITVSAAPPPPPPPPVEISIAPATAHVTTGGTRSFSATVTGSTNQAVTWSVVETAGGTITSAGLYTAPAVAGTYHVKAVAAADPAVSAQATITVSAPAAPPVIVSFAAMPAFLTEAGPVTLSWNVTGATSLSISPTIGTVTGTSTTITVPATTTYMLTAVNGNGDAIAATTVTVSPVNGGVAHPRVWLTPASLAALRSRAASGDAAWIALRNACDALALRPVQYPDGTGGGPNAISGGYQYYDYLQPMMTLGLGYQVAKTVDATRAANYAAKGRQLLLALSDPVHHGRESTDSGWSIRAYVPALALGYDWLYDMLSPAEKVQVYTEINRWVAWFDGNGFGREYPQGNYFAGYYCAKALGALATEGDNPNADAMWNDWLNRLHRTMVQPFYAQWLSGGGWPEGWNYGPNGTLNMLRPIVAARTAKGMDLLHDATKPFVYPENHALWMAHFTWPDLRSVDDRGFVYESDNPTATEAHWSTEYAGLLRLAVGATAPQMQRYARDIRTTTADKAEPWAEFMHWDNAAPETDYKVARSYRTTGDGQVAMRGNWSTNSVWAAFQAGPYTGNGHAAEEFYDQGALTIKRGGVQFLVNTWGAFMRHSPGTSDGNGRFNFLYNELYGTQTDGVYTGRRIFNTFIARRNPGYWGQFAYGPGETNTTLSRFEDGGAYVVMRGANLEMMYMTQTPITQWSREVLFVRPNIFLLYDRTATNSAAAEQWQGFHVLRTPVAQGGAAPGTHRYDVIDNSGVYAGSPLFRGRVSTLLPAGHTVNVVNVAASNKVYRLEVRPPAVASTTWLTVMDAAGSAASAAGAVPLTAANGGVLSGAIEGGYLTYADGSGLAALFSKSGTPPTLPVSFAIPSASLNRVVLPDLTPNADYSVTAISSNGQVTIQVTAGTAYRASAQGVLALQIDAAGVIAPLQE